MNDRPGSAAETRPFDITSLDLNQIPGQTDLFLDFLHRPEKVSRYYPSKSLEFSEAAESVLAEYTADRDRLCGFLDRFNKGLGAGSETLSNIGKLRSEGCVAVMTGQQAGLFTGPAYTLYKAVSAIRLARDLSASGIEAVPVFWIASEDHDLDEVRTTTFISDGGEQFTAEYPAPDAGGPRAVGSVRFDSRIGSLIDRTAEALGSSFSADETAVLLRDCYAEGETFSSAFGRLILGLLGKYGLILTSPLEPEFRSLAMPVVRTAVEKAEQIGDSLRKRDGELEADGYHSQVFVGEDFFPFFLMDEDGYRRPLRFAGSSKIERPDTGESWNPSGLIELLERDPAALSPNALMRPVVQDFVFPNVCYFGGAAEIAYFGQNSAIYELLERPVPAVRHRSSFTILDPRNRRTLDSYGLDFRDVLNGKDKAAAYVQENYLDPETAALFSDTKAEFERLIDTLEKRLSESEPTLAESLSKRRQKMLWHLETLHRKFLNAESFKDEVALKRIRYLFETALPDEALQERTVNFLSFRVQFGPRLTDWLIEAAGSNDEHKVLTF